MNTYLQDGIIFYNHSGILNHGHLVTDKFAADIKRTKISIYCLIVGLAYCSIELTIE